MTERADQVSAARAQIPPVAHGGTGVVVNGPNGPTVSNVGHGGNGATASHVGHGGNGATARATRLEPPVQLPTSPAMVCDRRGVVRHANAALARLLGLGSAEELIGEPTHRFLLGTDHDAALSWPGGGPASRVRVVRCPLPAGQGGSDLQLLLIVDVTDLQQAVHLLADERRRMAEVERVAGLGSWEFDPRTGETLWSDGHYELLAIEPGTVVPGANAVLDIVHPDDHEHVASYWADHMTSGNSIDIEYRVVRSDGAVRIVQGLAEAKRDAAGRLVRYTGSIRDITEQRRTERALAQERARLLEAQRISLMGSWSLDLPTRRFEFSEALVEMFAELGVDPHTDAMASVHADDRRRLLSLVPALTALGPDETVEVELRGPPGTERTFLVRARAERDGAGAVVRVLGTAQDVTEQRAAETRMLRSRQRFADLVSIAPVGIGLFDDADRLVNANDALCKLLGRPLDRLRGRTFARLTHPDVRPAPQLPTTEQLGGEDDYTVPQVVLVRPDDRRVSCELHVSVSVQDDGRRFRLVVFSDITERLRAAEVLRYQATHDDLTGLPNRAAVKQLIGELLAGPTRQQVAVLFCDIDNFKRVNDSLGHDAGDELLVALARRLVDGLPDGCTAARLSGDEYLVICRDTAEVGGVNQLVTTVSRLLRAAIPLRGQIVQVSATVGAAMPDGPQTGPEDLLRFADAAMYQAKDAGRGRVALANAALMASADGQVELEGQLREAVANDGLVLNFQPVVGSDGTIQTAEALVRWPHRERGLLQPDVFLPVAEQGDLLRELDRWVLRAALREAVCWTDLCGGRKVAVAVNLAGLVPGDVDFVDVVSAAVAESGIDWDRVVLELVETALVDLPSRARNAMDELVHRGVRFAVDDFGTGYSSLARLRELPAQVIKVDRQFVSGVGSDPLDFAVARAVVDMAKAMGRLCVAEGVETAAQFHVLRGLGIDSYQGFLFSRPLPPPEFRSVLAQGPLRVPRTR